MAYENWTTWDENDPSSELTVAANQITVASEDVHGACVDKLYGSNYFSGQFTHYIDFICTAQATTPAVGIWAISDIDDWKYSNLASGGLCIYLYPADGNCYIEKNGAYDSFGSSLSLSTRYYLKIIRDGSNNVTAYLYSDAAHTNLLDTSSAIAYSEASDYLSVAWNDYFGTWSGSLYNLDIGAGGGPITVNLSTAAIAATGQTLTLSMGAVSKALASGEMTAAGQPLTLQPGAVSKALATGDMTATGQATVITPGAVSKALAAGEIAATGQTITVGGTYTANLSSGDMLAEGQPTVITPGTVTKNLASADMTATGPTITVTSALIINLQTGEITVAGQTMTITPGAIVVTLAVALLTLLGLNLSSPNWAGGEHRNTFWRWFVIRSKHG